MPDITPPWGHIKRTKLESIQHLQRASILARRDRQETISIRRANSEMLGNDACYGGKKEVELSEGAESAGSKVLVGGRGLGGRAAGCMGSDAQTRGSG